MTAQFESEMTEAQYANRTGNTVLYAPPVPKPSQPKQTATTHELTEAEYAYLQRLVQRNLDQMADYPTMFLGERATVTAVEEKLHWLRRNAQLNIIQA